MKRMILSMVMAAGISLAFSPALAEEEDSALKKAAKLKVVQEADEDSAARKAVGAKAVGDIATDEDDSVVKKGVKLKVLKEAAED